ncbi:hemin uptake protein HemP [Paracoccus sp. p4-l81]|uniref:hemin uptake protein HemP n=1 Tax=unclassified Paracoccus (in: a-proteobacteria) TaxID=2688777 RepID=UPI0035BA7BA7
MSAPERNTFDLTVASRANPCPLDLTRLPLYDARQLTKSGVQALIALDDQVYTLRITRAGKLILTK